MRTLSAVLVALFALTAAACSQAELQKFETAYTVVTSAQVPAADIIAAANAFAIIEEAATQYLVYCKTNLTTSACSASNRRLVIKYGRAGVQARNQLRAALNNGATVGPRTLYDTLVNAITQLNASPAKAFAAHAQAPAPISHSPADGLMLLNVPQ